MQHEFVLDIVKKCKDIGLHTAIDTAGSVPLKLSKKVIDESDLLLLDIKALDNDVCIKLTGSDNKNTLETLDYCEKTKKPVWIRHVLVPSITLDEKMLIELAEFLKKYTVIENIELLPFHKMGEFKWEELNMKYELYDTPQPQPEEIKMAKDIFVSRGLPVR